MKRVILPILLLGLSSLALAHPHTDKPEEVEAKSNWSWPYFGKKNDTIKTEEKSSLDKEPTLSGPEFADRLEKRFKKHSKTMEQSLKEVETKSEFLREDGKIKSANDIRKAARAIEDMISESGAISNFADMMLDLAEDFDVETGDDGLALKFDGDPIGRINIKRDKHTDSTFGIEGFGRNMTVEKEVIKRNGRTKTRIIIEVDGDEEFNIDFRPKD